MERFPLRAIWLLAAAAIAGCGTGNRELLSLGISPSTATAKSSSVQFTATGYWSESPTVETPMPATWGACTTGSVVGPTTDVTVSSTGLATCASGAKGTYDVFAWDPQYGSTGPICNAVSACGPGCGRVSASADLTCP